MVGWTGLWHIWHSSRFQHQRIQIEVLPSKKFIYCTLLERQNKRHVMPLENRGLFHKTYRIWKLWICFYSQILTSIFHWREDSAIYGRLAEGKLYRKIFFGMGFNGRFLGSGKLNRCAKRPQPMTLLIGVIFMWKSPRPGFEQGTTISLNKYGPTVRVPFPLILKMSHSQPLFSLILPLQ